MLVLCLLAFNTYKNAGGKEQFDNWFSDIYLPEMAQGIASMRPGKDTLEDWPYGFAEPGTIGSPEMIGIEYNAQGGRIGYKKGSVHKPGSHSWWLMQQTRPKKQEGGLMDLGGMEKDYRQEGGFVPIGGQEKADDVPARLSKNEFVFTADAVRAAGGGDIDKGAEVMENVMNNLEQGGQVSEESQGLEGARNMFATAQRLEGVL